MFDFCVKDKKSCFAVVLSTTIFVKVSIKKDSFEEQRVWGVSRL